MLANVQPPFKNLQGDTFPGAVLVIEDAEFDYEKIESKKVFLKRTTAENYKRDEKETGETYEGLGGEIKFTVKYWTQVSNFQQGRKGYWLEGSNGELEFTMQIDEKWADRFNAIQGTETQKITRICEEYLKEVELTKLRAA